MNTSTKQTRRGNKMEKQITEFKVNEIIMRSAAFMAGKVQAVCTQRAKVDGFGREVFGNYRMVDMTKINVDKA